MSSCFGVRENYNGRFQGCAYSTGDYTTMGNPALCRKDISATMPKNPMQNLMIEGYSGMGNNGYGAYNVIGDASSCRAQTGSAKPGNPQQDQYGLKEGYCKSCSRMPESRPNYNAEMRKGNIKEPYCSGCHCGGDYNVFNYDMIEGFQMNNQQMKAAGYLGNMDFPPAAVMVPHQFVNNMKLSIEDPDNRWTYWLGGSPCPCKSGTNESGPKRRWLGVTSQ